MSKIITLCVMLLASTAWLLLAVWGEGGFAAFFANPARTGAEYAACRACS